MEKKVLIKSVTKEEIDRIQNLDLSTDFSELKKEFDPSFIASQFEKGINPPKFTNPKLWFIKGPLRTLISKFVEFYAIIDKKLSENRIKAFYSVLFELIKSKKRISRLEKKLEEIYIELNELKKTKHQAETSFYDYLKPYQTDFSKSITNRIEKISKDKKILFIYPKLNEELNYFQIKEFDFSILTNSHPEIFQKATNKIFQSDLLNFQNYADFDFFYSSYNLCLEETEILFSFFHLLFKQTNSTSEFLFSYKNQISSLNSPFEKYSKSKIEDEKLKTFLSGIGFKNINIEVDFDETRILSFYK